MFTASRFVSLLCFKSPTKFGTSCRAIRQRAPKNESQSAESASAKQKSLDPQTFLKDPYEYAPPIKRRSKSELWKPIAFTVGFSGCCFVGASIWHYERNKSYNDYLFNAKQWGYKQKEKFGDVRREVEEFNIKRLNEFFNKLSPGEKTLGTLIGINTLVYLCWRPAALRPLMYRYFTSSYFGQKLYSPMILSAFSHANLLHLGINMYVLFTFASLAIDKMLGVEQFLGFYLSAAAVSSSFSFITKALRNEGAVRALGASGAILALLTYVCCKYPDARLQIVFLPFFTFNGAQAVVGILLIDTCGLLFRWRMFDHAAHLGGSLFGIWYALYGERFFWQELRARLVKRWIEITGTK